MRARENEADLLNCCVAIATGRCQSVSSQAEANVCHVAAMIIGPPYLSQSTRLREVVGQYFADHPGEELPLAEVIRRGWIITLPRLRDALYRAFAA